MSHPSSKVVDLRSDTVTQPTDAMRAAMLAAPLGDDVFADDPSVNALQRQIAEMLGFEAALFVPTGTQSNLCAILSHCQRGDEYIVGQQAHCYRWEGGGAAVLGSVQPQPLDHQPDGTLALDDDRGRHQARRRPLRAHPAAGAREHAGRQAAAVRLRGAGHATRAAQGLARHLDGARLFNAAVAQAAALGTEVRAEARRIAGCFDSVSVCFSKGLGAPVGSALCGSREFIARAHRIRKMAGGGMRQAGLLAAAASHALEHHVDRLADDHALAQRLAQGLQGIDGLQVEAPQTNLLFVDLTGAARSRSAELLAHLKEHGVLATGLYRLRFATHLDVDAAGIDRAIGPRLLRTLVLPPHAGRPRAAAVRRRGPAARTSRRGPTCSTS